MYQSVDDTITGKHCYNNPEKKVPDNTFTSLVKPNRNISMNK